MVETNALFSLGSPAVAVYASGVKTRGGVKTKALRVSKALHSEWTSLTRGSAPLRCAAGTAQLPLNTRHLFTPSVTHCFLVSAGET